MLFADRCEAGRILAGLLTKYANRHDVLVLALPRGGVPVAFEVAYALRAPLDVFIVRKLGVPGHDELAMGAIATGGVRVVNEDVVVPLGLSDRVIDAVAALRKQGPARIVVAVPVAAPETCEEFKSEVDETVCAATPRMFSGVGRWYEDFSQTSDDEVHELLAQAKSCVS